MNTKLKKASDEITEDDLMIFDLKTPLPKVDGPKKPNENLTQLMDTMNEVDTDSPEAQVNATSIDDNNGDRIELDEDLRSPRVVKK